jgi:nucleotide-binding universal stress UspA family protein
MNAIPVPEAALRAHEEDMLRVLAEHYVGPGFASVASVLFALLLLSASSTAVMGMLSIQFCMARDGELPRGMARLNRFGVPQRALLIATLVPIVVLVVQNDLTELAKLYAIGVVGAIALNTYATAAARRPGIRRWERVGLGTVAALMVAIWVTVCYEKRSALGFAAIVVGTGLVARLAFRKYREIARPAQKIPFPPEAQRFFVASRGDLWIVDEVFHRAAEIGAAVVVCLIREASFVLGPTDEGGLDPAIDPEAAEFFEETRRRAQDLNIPVRLVYEMSTAPMAVIAEHAATLGVSEVHVGGSRRTTLEKVLRGNPLEDLRALLPEEVQMVVHRPPHGARGAPTG